MNGIFLLLCLVQPLALAGEGGVGAPRIAYLTLDLNANPPKLLEVRIVPGRLKSPSQAQPTSHHLVCRLVHAEKGRVFESFLPKPDLKIAEFEGADGALTRQEVRLPSERLLVRVPFFPGNHTLTLTEVRLEGSKKIESEWVRIAVHFNEESGAGHDR